MRETLKKLGVERKYASAREKERERPAEIFFRKADESRSRGHRPLLQQAHFSFPRIVLKARKGDIRRMVVAFARDSRNEKKCLEKTLLEILRFARCSSSVLI